MTGISGHELYPGQASDCLSETRRAFGFLEERAFELGAVHATYLEYHSPGAIVIVGLCEGQDRAYRSVQMAVAPAGTRDGDRFLSMYVLEQLRPPPDDAPFTPLRQALLGAGSREELRASLERIAELARTQFAEQIGATREELVALQDESSRRRVEAAAQIRAEDDRRAAGRAFKAGEYVRAAMLYEAAGDHLQRHERMRLDYARRKAGL
jgi:hypothetical protein